MIRNLIKKIFKLYDIEDLEVGGRCGCCGSWMGDAIVPKAWNWDLCERCIERGNKSRGKIVTIG
jgi:hypothetical protein